MPRRFDFDRYMRDHHTLTPGQRDAVVRMIVRDAREDRALAIRAIFRAIGRWSWKAAARGLERLAAAWRRYDQRRRLRVTAAQLYGMGDRELKDIGLRRGDIDFVLSGIKDPTRVPRSARHRLGATDYSGPNPEPAQRAAAPLLLRNECAG